jgi:hypothetical protein
MFLESPTGFRLRLVVFFFAFAGVALAIFEPALQGPFFSDDRFYIVHNPYLHELSWENTGAILDPWGQHTRNTLNYAPAHMLAHALEWSLWGDTPFGYHVVNVVLHAVTSLLLVVLLYRHGVPFVAGVLGGAFFLLHPANVEAVAWISQLKTIMAVGFACAALLAHPRHPALGLAFFTLGLLSKASALFALPVAAVLAWSARSREDPWRANVCWLLAWVLVFAVYAVPQFSAFQRMGGHEAVLPPDLLEMRTLAAIGARYLVMAATSYGVSAFHQPPVALSWLDPWWLGGLILGALLAWRCIVTVWRREREAAWWVWAGAAYLPTSQIFPFLYPMADRYLYCVLPGLIGAVLVGGTSWLRKVTPKDGGTALLAGRNPLRIAAVASLLIAGVFGFRTSDRAQLWEDDRAVLADAAIHYPDGIWAHWLAAGRAAEQRDADTTVTELRASMERGFDQFIDIIANPAYADVRDTLVFHQLIRDVTQAWIDRSHRRPNPTQVELRMRANAYAARGDFAEAVATLEEALRVGGIQDAKVREELALVRSVVEAIRLSDGERTAEHAREEPDQQ